MPETYDSSMSGSLPRSTPLLWSVIACTVSVAVAVPAGASEGVGDPPSPAPESSTSLHSSDTREPMLAARAAGSGATFVVDETTRPVAPGLDLTRFDRYDARGWVRVAALTADLSTPGLTLDYASAGKVAATAPLTSALKRDRAVAGVNADFFDIGRTGAPLGVGVDRQRGLLHGAREGRPHSFTLDAENAAAIAQSYLRATIRPKGRTALTASNLNSPTVTANGIGIFTPAWGSASRRGTVSAGATKREVLVRDGRVRANRTSVSTGPVAAGTLLLLGHGDGARRLAGLEVGTRVSVSYGLSDGATRVAVGGSHVLLRDGALTPSDDVYMHPRTAIGIDTDLGRVIVVTVDGRQAHSRGLTLRETGVLLKELGAEEALNLDGGGSSTMLARESGESAAVVNAPSDGHLRSVPNGLGFAVSPGSGTLRGFRIEPASDVAESHRVLTGLSRVLVARGHDERLDPVPGRATWSGSPAVSASAGPSTTTVAVGREPGTGTVTASSGGASGEFRLRVLGRVHRLETGVSSIALAGRSASQSFDVRGYDARGFGTWVEPRDVKLSYDRDRLDVRRTGRGFTVKALVASASEVVTVTAGGRMTHLGVTVGLQKSVVDTMDSLSGWTASAFPAAADARLVRTSDRRGRAGRAVALRYALLGRRATRAVYVDATPVRALPERARRIGLWVRGDGKGAWLRLVAQDVAGTRSTVNLARRVSWRGWRFVSTAVPAGLSQPLDLVQVYAVETNSARRYSGTLAFDDVTVFTERTAPVPVTPPLRDAMVADREPLGAGGLEVAVMSGAGVSASAPSGPVVERARRAMREIVAADPDLVLLNGDLVRRGTDADLRLARQLISEELEGKVAWRYLPGDGETGTSGGLAAFERQFGSPVRVFDLRGTRFVLLNSAPGTFRLGGFSQLVRLRSELASAASDPAVTSVVVAAHHPTGDPTSGSAAGLDDPREGELVEALIADFRADSEKPVAYVGSHARRFGLTRDDDVPVVAAGVVGDPVARGVGAFAGWTRLGIDGGAARWLGAEFRPLVDQLAVDAPTSLAPGTTADAGATLTQLGRTLTVGYPMNAVWVPSATLHVGPAGSAPAQAVASYDPVTGRLTGLRAGSTELVVRVNQTTARRSLTVG